MPLFQAAAIALIALILTPGLLFYFDVTPKLVVLFAAAALSLLPLRRGGLMNLALLTLAILALSTALSPNPALSFYGTHWRQFGALTQAAILIFACSLALQANHATFILRIVTAAGALTALFGIAQYLGWDPIIPPAAYHIGEGTWTIVRPPSTLGYVSYFATWLLFVGFLALALPGRFPKFCAALAFLAMLLTGTRAAFLGFAAGALVWTAFRFRGRAPSGPAVRRLGLLCIAVAGCLILLYLSPAGHAFRSRTRWFAEDPWGGARPLLWRDSLLMALQRPWTGYGPETFTATFPHYESAALARAYPDFAHESSHNIFLDAFLSQGIAGLALLLAWCVVGFASTWRIRATHPELAAALAAALAAGIVAQQFTVFTIPTALVFFATIALASGLASAPVQTSARRLPFAIPLIYFAARAFLADHSLALAQHDLAAGNLPAAAVHYRASGETSDLWYSRTLLGLAAKAPTLPARIQAFQMAAAAGDHATHSAEDPFNAWYSLASIYAARNDAPNAERCLRAAIAAHPNWFKPHWTLSQVLRLGGRTEEAQREHQLAIDLDGGKHPEVSVW